MRPVVVRPTEEEGDGFGVVEEVALVVGEMWGGGEVPGRGASLARPWRREGHVGFGSRQGGGGGVGWDAWRTNQVRRRREARCRRESTGRCGMTVGREMGEVSSVDVSLLTPLDVPPSRTNLFVFILKVF